MVIVQIIQKKIFVYYAQIVMQWLRILVVEIKKQPEKTIENDINASSVLAISHERLPIFRGEFDSHMMLNLMSY